ncbi:PREDICTED: acidic leucine-rich nuclear phosphoprotein 32 family member C-like [Myotis davidii]|uniref:acidic leucine-rich nuclear phosphoprotein 32 family member C-like n=1 Tax=Myotis davidii TaxID=225400 RepID=UPI0003EC3941|nr:PREDICTED: acidic leucine-rich nuclear phosphoprotein 32 family member C-like [Myotis davidii]
MLYGVKSLQVVVENDELRRRLLEGNSPFQTSCFARLLQLSLEKKKSAAWDHRRVPSCQTRPAGHQLRDHHQGLKGEGSCGGGREWKQCTREENANEENGEQEADNEVDEEEEKGGEEEEEEEGDGEEGDGDEDEEAEAAMGKRAAEKDEGDDVVTKKQKTDEDD